MIRRLDENTLVIYVPREEISEVVQFLEGMGLSFEREKHGFGPEHWACEREGRVLEIYPENMA